MENILKEEDAARYLNIAVQTLRNWRCRCEGPPYLKIGRRAIRYHSEDLEVFSQSHRIVSFGNFKHRNMTAK